MLPRRTSVVAAGLGGVIEDDDVESPDLGGEGREDPEEKRGFFWLARKA